MERVDATVSPSAGSFLRFAGKRTLLDDRVTITHWRLAVAAPGFTDTMSRLIAASYLAPKVRWAHPEAGLTARLPQKADVRKGDFGEIIAGVVYAQRMGRAVPFQRLEAKPIGSATLQGPDLLALTLDHGADPAPVVVEVKYRAEISPAKDLKALAESLANIDEDYLVSAWAAGVHLMESHPEENKAFALSAAQQLARLVRPDQPVPPHERQAVIVTSKNTLTAAKIEEHWGTTPPVSELHVVMAPNLEVVMNQLYEATARLSYADAASGVPALLRDRRHLPGIAAPVSSTEAKQAVAAGRTEGTLPLVEAALWLLADWDGMGIARARQIREHAADDTTRGLAEILTAIGSAITTLAGHQHLVGFAKAVRAALRREIGADELRAAIDTTAMAIRDEGLAAAVRYVGAAVVHRLPRHPGVLTAGAGATGAHVQHVVDRMLRVGKYALWPSQVAAIGGGLLDRGHPSLAIKMPTSAGKTALIELLVADALDSASDTVVAVLAPTRALVSQLSSDLRQALPPTATVRSSHGRLDFDTEEPDATGILSESGVAVMTPERFDLEWRRAKTGDEHANVSQVRLLVVDEAHLLTAPRRGTRLELVIARALRQGVRVVLVSAQFPTIERIAEWISGRPIESDWSPTWLERLVYFPNLERTHGLLQQEVGDPYPCLTLSKSDADDPAVCAPVRPAEAAALADLRQDEGLVVLYSNQRSRMEKLVAAVEARSGRAAPSDDLETIAGELDAAQPRYASLLRSGIGVHHAGVPRAVRQAVEQAARKNLLRFVVCTPTLLEGVDFPTRTVIAAYPPQTTNGQPEVARLRNLAGRAGRAGRFTRGTLIVMLGDGSKARKWLRAFRSTLPATPSALEGALRQVRAFANQMDLLEARNDTRQVVAELDAIILAAAVEGAVIDGDLRHTLEELLGRTLWWTGTTAAAREAVLAQATRRASHVARIVNGDRWTTTFYRAGLPLASSVKLRDALAPHVKELAEVLQVPDGAHDESLIWLASAVAPAAPELANWRDFAQADLHDALLRWLAGEPTSSIAEAHAELWPEIEDDLEALLPWVVTALIEYTATALGDPDLRNLAHQRLGVARLRYGVPDRGLCDHVRRGADRVVVAELAAEFAALPAIEQVLQDRDDFITARLAAAPAAQKPAPTAGHVAAHTDLGRSQQGNGSESTVPAGQRRKGPS